ncbi:cell division protein FtsZ [Pyrococcus abyssi]|uniref:Cell division protein FtsZ 1 n=1 Tax=Pyrococcus abyssi (strain GE5 / Orsay) TaxID=272844 RepID=FTSZ1_PYRAB|nr:cell division protein FtsZ [Pyrococcus abyssi]Q9V2S0.1 RecName: Full=Cell division protein FtsZ 1 [Pyrococcus abyssi GE5]CAB48928.1 ftsZ-1 cell division GTPase, ftsZ homolog [Pyrococcus abyssi GE5]CCE69370.1 TPA: cell division protein FtsZ [Pyrococcus abyssi GE5]
MLKLVENVVERVSAEEQKPQEIQVPQSSIDEELKKIVEQIKARIYVVGVGGAGCNTVNRMMEVGVTGAKIIAVNTDAQDLLKIKAHQKILIGKELTRGLGAGNDPKIGEEAAKESERELREALEGADMVFVTCGLGGGTGTGAAPVIAEMAKKMGALTVSVVTLPFTMEGIRRAKNAEYGLKRLAKASDTVIVIPNDKLLEVAPKLPIQMAFKVADEILVQAVKGITELITKPGLVNLDFNDVRAVMKDGGVAMIGIGESDSEKRALEAAEQALNSPLLDVDISGAKGALISISGADVKLEEAQQIIEYVTRNVDPKAQVIWGIQLEPELEKTIRVMVIVTGVTSRYITFQEETPEPSEEEVPPVKIDIPEL